MRLNIIENIKRNMFWGAIRKIYQIAIPFILRSIFIHQLGIAYVGLGGLFSSLFNILNLAELGVSSSTLYFLYQPVAENDEKTIQRLLSLIKDIYRKIGFFILGAGLLLMPLLGLLVFTELPADINIYAIYLLNLVEIVLSYWLFPGKSIVLEVYQRNDVSDRIYLTTSTIRYALQIIMLFLLPNYYIYIIIIILTQVLEKIFLAYETDRRYPEYRIVLPVPQDMKKKVLKKSEGLLFHKIGDVIVNSADALVITSFLGLGVMGKYQNYLQIMTAVSGIIGLIRTSWYAGVGNIMAREGISASYQTFEHYTFLEFCVSTVCCCCFLNLYQPFISLWVGADMLLDDGIVLLLCLYFYAGRLMSPGNMFESIGGIWAEDKYRPFMEGIFNLGLNLILVRFLGLYGILLSTILSMTFLSIPWLYYTVVRNLFKGSVFCYLRKLLVYTISTAVIIGASYFVCRMIPAGDFLPTVFFVRALTGMSVSFMLLYIMYHKCEAWKWMVWNIFRLFHIKD